MIQYALFRKNLTESVVSWISETSNHLLAFIRPEKDPEMPELNRAHVFFATAMMQSWGINDAIDSIPHP